MKLYILKKDKADFKEQIARIGADAFCVDLLDNKTRTHVFLMKDTCIEQANILKQTALSVGCDVAIHRDVISGTRKFSDAILMCNEGQLEKIELKLREQPFSLGKTAAAMLDMVRCENVWEVRGRNILADRDYIIMGILNATPDSFYDGGQNSKISTALERCDEMIQNGADIIDIGGESTRPFSSPVSADEEKRRIIPIIENVRKKHPSVIISADTRKADVAENAINAGADIINDISGFTFDKELAERAAKADVSAIVMHMRGTPENMQDNTEYSDMMPEILEQLQMSIEIGKKAGIRTEKIVIDPGIGFSKTVEQNFDILRQLDILYSLGRPVLLGTSNKSFIGKSLDSDIDGRIEGTIASNVAAYLGGVSIFRVHNVKEHKKAFEIARRIKNV